jgi:hypothetical protein
VTLCGVISLVTLSSVMKVDDRLLIPKFDLDKIVCSVNFIRYKFGFEMLCEGVSAIPNQRI